MGYDQVIVRKHLEELDSLKSNLDYSFFSCGESPKSNSSGRSNPDSLSAILRLLYLYQYIGARIPPPRTIS
jgi:hypothetical protein